jgi:catechol 2,3-dioxygenase-like lactoylglutathione lyase family enzyme
MHMTGQRATTCTGYGCSASERTQKRAVNGRKRKNLPMINVERIDYIRVPVTDIDRATDFYGHILGLPLDPNSPHDDWVEYEAGNVTLAVMTPHTHGSEFVPLPPGTLAFRVPDVAEAKAKLEAAGVEVNDVWDSGACRGAGFSDPDGNRILLHRRYAPYPDGTSPDDQT